MSNAYNEYLIDHISGVKEAYKWLKKNFPEYFDFTPESPGWSIEYHDESKYSGEEYAAYDAYFYGGNKSYKVVQDFNKAWLHHIHENPHHWQHWLLFEDDPDRNGSYICIEMPREYVLEMISDWWSFSWKKGDLYEIFNWYEDHKGIMQLHKNTRKLVEEILDRMRGRLSATGERQIGEEGRNE